METLEAVQEIALILEMTHNIPPLKMRDLIPSIWEHKRDIQLVKYLASVASHSDRLHDLCICMFRLMIRFGLVVYKGFKAL